jgi:soluble lytic murein transglycosylase-like protein
VLDVLFEGEISKYITESQGMGVAGQIYKSLTGEELKGEKNISSEKLLGPVFKNQNKTGAKISKSNSIKPSEHALNRINQYDDLISKAAKKYNIDKKLIKSVILTESAGKVNAHSKANAKGLMQLIDSTATAMGVENVWDPKDNIFGGTKYLAKMLKNYDGDIDLALAAYNAGPGNVNKYNGIPPFSETQNYIKRVNNYLNILE